MVAVNLPSDDEERMDSEPERTDTEATDIERSDSESEDENRDPWWPIVDEVMQKYRAAYEEMKSGLMLDGMDEKSADENAHSNFLPELQQDLMKVYMERLVWLHELKKDPVHKKIVETKNSLNDENDFDPEEAIEAAIDRRKFLIKRLLKEYSYS